MRLAGHNLQTFVPAVLTRLMVFDLPPTPAFCPVLPQKKLVQFEVRFIVHQIVPQIVQKTPRKIQFSEGFFAQFHVQFEVQFWGMIFH
jgi:hypothetical protein